MDSEQTGDTRVRTTCDVRSPAPKSEEDQRQLDAGASVGRYLILDLLGSGGMSVVYGAYDPQLDRRIALKLMRAADEGRDREYVRERLLREAQALARLAHPNVVTVHDVGTVGDQVFLAMEYVEGQTLGEWMRERHTVAEVLEVFGHAGDGLVAAHAEGLVHRDFKPDNVMLDESGRVRVMDFGLARPSGTDSCDDDTRFDSELLASRTALSRQGLLSDPLGAVLTVTGAVMGTPAYMAPEQHRGSRSGPASDQFSFCVTLFEALYGQRPFEAPTRAELRANVLRGIVCEPPRRPEVSRGLRRVLQRGLSVRPADRWPSMAALLAEIARVSRTRRRRRIAWGGTLTLGVGLSFVALRGAPAHSGPCAEQPSITNVWGADQRAELAGRFDRSVTPWARVAWPSIAAQLDQYVADWGAVHEVVCAGSPSPAPDSLRCLDDRRMHLETIVAGMSHADATAVELAREELSALPSAWDCAESGDDGQPRGAEHQILAGKLVALRADLVRGGGEDTMEEAKALVDQAQSSRSLALQAEAWWLRGEALVGASRWFDAKLALDRAWTIALRSGRDDIAMRVAMTQAHVAEALGNAGHATRWVADAVALAERNPPSPLVQARVYLAEAAAFRSRDDLDAARSRLEKARRIRSEHLGSEAPAVADVIVQLAELQRRDRQDRAALLQLDEARAIFKRSVGSGHAQTAQVDLEIGQLLAQMGRHDEARAVLERAVGTARRAYRDEASRFAAFLVPLADAWILLGLDTRAEAAFAEADALVARERGAEHPQRVAILLRWATAPRALGAEAEADESLAEALRVAEHSLGGRHPTAARVLDAQVAYQCDRGAFDVALTLANRAESIWREHDSQPRAHARSLVGRARAHVGLADHASALVDLSGAIALLEQPGGLPALEAEARLMRAHALDSLRPGSVAATREAETAAALLEHAPHSHQPLRGELRRWRSGHRPPAP